MSEYIKYIGDGSQGTLDLSNGMRLVSVIVDDHHAVLQLLKDGHPTIDVLVRRTAADQDIKSAVDLVGALLANSAP